MMTGMPRRGDDVGKQVRLGAVVDDQVVAELVGDPHCGGDVVGPVTVLTPGDLPAQHLAERLELQVAVDRLALGLRLAPLGLDACR